MSRKPETLRAAQHQAIGCCWKGYGDNMKEIWKDIAGYEGIYAVSNLGRVRSLDRYVQCVDSVRYYKGRIMKLHKQRNGYLQVCLRISGKHEQALVHRLVAEAFIPNHGQLPCVNHKDENKENNNADNLEWCTQKYNNHYGEGNKTRCRNARDGAINKLAKPVLQYSLDGKLLDEYYSAMEAGRQNHCSQAGISNCCNGKQKTAYGYVWRYKEAE